MTACMLAMLPASTGRALSSGEALRRRAEGGEHGCEQEYMQCVTAVEPEWLAELGPMFFSIKQSHSSRLEARAKQRAAKAAMESEMGVAAAAAAKARAEEAARNKAVSASQRSAIATPGLRTPTTTPRRTFGL